MGPDIGHRRRIAVHRAVQGCVKPVRGLSDFVLGGHRTPPAVSGIEAEANRSGLRVRLVSDRHRSVLHAETIRGVPPAQVSGASRLWPPIVAVGAELAKLDAKRFVVAQG
jgi:hypothetical protein